jgi:hypothetical protein
MGSILEYCVVTRANIPTKISVQQALRNRREFMSCPECGGRVRAHDAYKADSLQVVGCSASRVEPVTTM